MLRDEAYESEHDLYKDSLHVLVIRIILSFGNVFVVIKSWVCQGRSCSQLKPEASLRTGTMWGYHYWNPLSLQVYSTAGWLQCILCTVIAKGQAGPDVAWWFTSYSGAGLPPHLAEDYVSHATRTGPPPPPKNVKLLQRPATTGPVKPCLCLASVITEISNRIWLGV